MKWTRSRTASALAVGTASALLLSACSSGGTTPSASTTSTPTETAKKPVEISVAYWGNFGLESLAKQYMADNPYVTLKLVSGDYGATHDALTQSLIAGSGASTVSAIDEGYITGFVAQSDKFVNLIDLGAGKYKDNYLPWKWAQASNADESVTIGLGSDVGGLALCYRTDLFEAAGLPTASADVDAAIGDTWAGFIKLGQDYQAKSGKGKFWVDNANNILVPAQTQLGTGYGWYNKNNELDMAASKPAFDIAIDVIDAGLSANIPLWSPEWNTGFSGCSVTAWRQSGMASDARFFR